MKSKNRYIVFIFLMFCFTLPVFLTSCAGRSGEGGADSAQNDSASIDNEYKKSQPGDSAYHFSGREEIEKYLRNSPDAKKFAKGILPVIARETPDYADKLISALATHSSFLVVDKASMRVILYDRYGRVVKSYGMACARNYGTKHIKADSRTPEGFFSVQGKYDSTNWLYTDDYGRTSQVKGQFGPRFIRLKIPNTSQIGIHGTASPWSIGHRASHGCIRITNENIMELYDLVEKGMPVIVLPGKRDRAVNRSEGYHVDFFPTEPEYAMSEQEKSEKLGPRKIFTSPLISKANNTAADSVATDGAEQQEMSQTPAAETKTPVPAETNEQNEE